MLTLGQDSTGRLVLYKRDSILMLYKQDSTGRLMLYKHDGRRFAVAHKARLDNYWSQGRAFCDLR